MSAPLKPAIAESARRTALTAWSTPLLVAIATFVVVYGVELFSFGLSVDEEVAFFETSRSLVWVQQGRWGMGLLLSLFPHFEAIPFVSTILFGTGLVFATWRATHDFRLDDGQATLFAALHVGFPLWLHIAQFNTLAGGFGFAIAATAIGSSVIMRGGRRHIVIGMVLLAFAMAVYQTLALYALLYLIIMVQRATPVGTDADADHTSPLPLFFGRMAAVTGLWAISVIVYWAIQKASLSLLGLETAYVDDYLQIGRLLADPKGTLHTIWSYVASLLSGSHSIYLGWGAALLALPWLGLLRGGLPLTMTRRPSNVTPALMHLIVAFTGVVLLAIPTIPSIALLPARAYVVLPLLAAWAGCQAIPDIGGGSITRVRWFAIGYLSIVAASIGSSLFYTDQVVRNADALMSRDIASAMHAAARSIDTPETPFTLVGQYQYPEHGQIRRVEQFGKSFYDQDGGNVYRVSFYLRLLGVSGFVPVPLAQRLDLVPEAREMPSWPDPGSVQAVNGVVVVKLSEPTYQQLPP